MSCYSKSVGPRADYRYLAFASSTQFGGSGRRFPRILASAHGESHARFVPTAHLKGSLSLIMMFQRTIILRLP